MRQSMGKTSDTIALSSKVVSGNSLRIVIRANKWTATSGCAKIILDLFVTKKPTSHTNGWFPKEGYIYIRQNNYNVNILPCKSLVEIR